MGRTYGDGAAWVAASRRVGSAGLGPAIHLAVVVDVDADAIGQALALPQVRVSAAAHVDAAAAYPNPELSYVREQPLDALGAVDDEVTLPRFRPRAG